MASAARVRTLDLKEVCGQLMLLASLAVGLVAGFAPSPHSRTEPRAVSRFVPRHAVCAPRAAPRLCSADEAVGKSRPLVEQTAADRMLWDTVNTEEERPRLLDALEGRDYLTSIFLLHGVYVGGLNIVGEYGEHYAMELCHENYAMRPSRRHRRLT